MFQCLNCYKNNPFVKPKVTINFDNTIIYNQEYMDIPPDYNSSSLWIITSPQIKANTKQYKHHYLLSQLTGEENSYFLQFPCYGNENNSPKYLNSWGNESSSRNKENEITLKNYTSLRIKRNLTKIKKYLMDNSF